MDRKIYRHTVECMKCGMDIVWYSSKEFQDEIFECQEVFCDEDCAVDYFEDEDFDEEHHELITS